MSGNDRLSGKIEPLLSRLAPRPVQISEEHIQALLIGRRGREALFGAELFSDPAWDILLELYAPQHGGPVIRRADLAKATSTPWSVVERWVAALSARGLVTAEDAGATAALKLTTDGAAKMSKLASRWASAFTSV